MKKFYSFCIIFSFSFLVTAQTNQGKLVTGTTRIKRVETAPVNQTVASDVLKTQEAADAPLSNPPTGNSPEVGIKEGALSVTSSGSANYTIPISIPPGINNIVPSIALSYNSQGGNGTAGFGWNLSGVSSITRIPSTKFHDGIIDPVDFDALDRFAFDGQRLVVKSGTGGTYGAAGTVYETENFSNIQITSYGIHPNGANFGPAYFVIEYPDGSKAYYGNSDNSRSITDWAITYWENPQGVRINYNYVQTYNILNISSIKYGSRGTEAPINEIQFIYKNRWRREQMYVGGHNLIRSTLLSQITTKSNGVPYNYHFLHHQSTDLGYERLTEISEISGDGTKQYNPTRFVYDNTTPTILGSPVTTNLMVGNITSSNAGTVSGDFDGDGGMDFILYPTTGPDAKAKYWVFSGLRESNSLNIGWEHTVGKFEEIFPVSWLNYTNKLMPYQGWVVVKENTFTTYAQAAVGIIQQDQKMFTFPKLIYYSEHPSSCIRPRPPIKNIQDIPKTYLSGDFNGDGLTDIIAIERNFTYSYSGPCDLNNQLVNFSNTYIGDAYFVNLDPRQKSDFATVAGKLNAQDSSKLLVADFNGDGTSDIYVFDAGKVRIYSLNANKQFELLFQTTENDDSITLKKPILMGDYNGDGKTDFIIPKGEGSQEWYKYSSTGINLIKETEIYLGFDFPTNTPTTTHNVIPSDYNNDGKTDLLLTTSSRSVGDNVESITVTCFINQDGTFTKRTNDYYSGSISNQSDIYPNALPIFLSSNHPNQKLELAFINNNKIFIFNSSKDFSQEHLLKTIVNGNGVTESISYQPLTDKRSSWDILPAYSPSGYTEFYPNMDVIAAPTFQVVSKLEKTSATVYKKQLFSYYGAVVNVEGLGFLGFRGAVRTNWFDDTTPIISSVSKNDINLRGTNIENYTTLGIVSPSSNVPSNFITKNALTFESQLLSNKVFKLQNTVIQQWNGLDNTGSKTITVYDAANNPTQSTTTAINGTTVEQTAVTTINYESPSTVPYVVGRPSSKTQSVSVSGDMSSTEEQYFYTNHLLTQVKKKGTNTDFITENNVYDGFGNITQKTISVPGLAPRSTSYQYDTSGRFLIKSTDIEGLTTTFDYNASNGLLISETNPYGLTTSYLYDSWYKKIKTTDYLGKSKTITYSRSGSNAVVETNADDGSQTTELIDDLGRKFKSSTKDITGIFSSVDYQYDIYDRNIKVY